MTRQLILPRPLWLKMRRHVWRTAPLEACGLLAGRDGRVELSLGVRNADRSPVSFSIAPQNQWRAFQRMESLGLELLAIYHSHPNGPAHPSATDIRQAFYAVAHLIWSREAGRWQAGAYWIDEGVVSRVELMVE